MNQQQLNEIAFKCSQYGAEGYMVKGIILPQTATQVNPIYIIQKPKGISGTSTPWYGNRQG